MPNTNIMLGFPNRTDESTLSSGSWSSTLPLTNLQTREIAEVARTTNTDESSTRFIIDLGQPRNIDILALVNHNASFDAKITIDSSTVSNFASIQDTYTADVWAGVSDADWVIDELEWENDNFWIGSYTAEDIAGFTAVSTHNLQSFRSARYFRVQIKDVLNEDGYFEIGRLFIGPAVQPTVNYSYGAGLAYETNTAIETALNGAEYFDVREPFRVFRFSLEMMPSNEAYGKFLEIVRRAGVHGEIFVIPDPDDLFQGLRRNFMGRNRQLNPLEQTLYADNEVKNTMAFEIKELR
jgi:hypothetical protein